VLRGGIQLDRCHPEPSFHARGWLLGVAMGVLSWIVIINVGITIWRRIFGD